jgi:23S rRNA (adenine2503-C2)-methyltransferase
MPINRSYGVQALLRTCKRYILRTGRRISFEYAPIKGVNDSQEQIVLLAKQMKNLGGHVNIIQLNRAGGDFNPANAHEFCKRLITLGVNATVRRSLGQDIDAACGMLRKRGGGDEIESMGLD